MGTKMVPAYANLFMAKLEEKVKHLGINYGNGSLMTVLSSGLDQNLNS